MATTEHLSRSIKRLSSGPKFELGQIVATSNCLNTLTDEYGPEIALTLTLLLRRHQHGDWGILDDEDWGYNDADLRNGGRLLSKYAISDEHSIYIITEWDRSATTIMFPEDY